MKWIGAKLSKDKPLKIDQNARIVVSGFFTTEGCIFCLHFSRQINDITQTEKLDSIQSGVQRRGHTPDLYKSVHVAR